MSTQNPPADEAELPPWTSSSSDSGSGNTATPKKPVSSDLEDTRSPIVTAAPPHHRQQSNRDLEKQTTNGSGLSRKRTRGEQPPDSEDGNKPKDPNLVEWDGEDDPGNPQNWSGRRRWIITAALGATTFVVTFASSVFSTAIGATAIEFNRTREVMTLGTSLFIIGFAFGPIVWGPLSELYGRKYPLYFGYFVFGIFQ